MILTVIKQPSIPQNELEDYKKKLIKTKITKFYLNKVVCPKNLHMIKSLWETSHCVAKFRQNSVTYFPIARNSTDTQSVLLFSHRTASSYNTNCWAAYNAVCFKHLHRRATESTI